MEGKEEREGVEERSNQRKELLNGRARELMKEGRGTNEGIKKKGTERRKDERRKRERNERTNEGRKERIY